jgi:hypothetical protein
VVPGIPAEDKDDVEKILLKEYFPGHFYFKPF